MDFYPENPESIPEIATWLKGCNEILDQAEEDLKAATNAKTPPKEKERLFTKYYELIDIGSIIFREIDIHTSDSIHKNLPVRNTEWKKVSERNNRITLEWLNLMQESEFKKDTEGFQEWIRKKLEEIRVVE